MSRRTTISDVAARAGVSKATVSRVLSGTYPVSERTARAVRRAVDDLDYTASARARSLATGRADAIAVVVSEPLDVFFADPTFSRILQGIADELSGTETVPVLLPTATRAEQRKALRLVLNQSVDAVVHLSPWVDSGLLDELIDHRVPVVLCGQDDDPERMRRFSLVYSDDRLGAADAAEHLVRRGARRPVAILGVPDQPAAVDRLSGYRQAYPDLDGSRIRWGGWSEAAGALAMRELLDAGVDFDALLAGSDRIARGAMSVLRAEGLDVPGDVAVIGYDDHPVAVEQAPRLTTIAQPMHLQGRTACRLAREMVAGGEPRTIVLPTELRVRDTA
ncbi:LacI family transcriptional regulator [Actinomyces sp. B33]|uniref:LacI family DNA-binding transcriptional regulator n=1 Tax=Actinomyces sp. B33 TaxID=2942131 RepID=UPI00234034DA|nr:LacI family DNA-binding transcriptional regulator [Actinomyces sp. B33]MDC4233141.1 LacI family transcriptional regulator [Actinomyces sp. B33]